MTTRGLYVFLACVLSSLTASRAAGQAQAISRIDPIAIDAYLRGQTAARRLPGLAVAVVDGKRVVLLRGYGCAGGDRPVTAQTQFYIGSCTKSFTALATMQLVAQGKLELDAPVRRYLPWFRVADEAASDQITVRHLLNNTSGLSEAGDPHPNDRHASLTEAAHALKSVHPNAPAGTKYQYYNQNYRVLGSLSEHVSAQSYGNYLRDHVLTPPYMSNTTTDPGAAHDLAQGHAWVFGFSLPRPQGSDPGALSSGRVISTAEDLSHYLVALLNDGHYGDGAVADPATLTQLFALPSGASSAGAAPPPRVLALLGTSTGIEYGYAMGWLVTQTPQGHRIVFHTGSMERFHAEILLLPTEKRGCAILTNRNSVLLPLFEPDPLWIGLAQLMLGGHPASSPVRWRVRLFVFIVVLDIGYLLFRIARLPRWKKRSARRTPALRWALALLDAALPAAFLVGIPMVLSSGVRIRVTWLGFLDFIPDVAAWLLISASLSLLRGLAKIAMLARA